SPSVRTVSKMTSSDGRDSEVVGSGLRSWCVSFASTMPPSPAAIAPSNSLRRDNTMLPLSRGRMGGTIGRLRVPTTSTNGAFPVPWRPRLVNRRLSSMNKSNTSFSSNRCPGVMNVNMNHLAVFHAVAQTGSMTRGAERLDISQPAVSKQVQELESALGVHLFDRIGRQVRLSQAGAVLADYAQRLFALAQEAEEVMADVRAVGRGRLAIGASTTIGTYLLPGVVAEVWRRHPDVELLVEIGKTQQIHRRLATGERDGGLTEGFVEEEELDAEVFHRDELVVIASPSHRLAGQARVPQSAVRQEAFVLREPGSGTRAVEKRALARLNFPVRA